jgi:ABC-type Zn uptake system ZnuABC Zn-binding protein ZnuA
MKIVTYHRSWGYFFNLFGLKVAGEIEPKPGIPPSPKHIHELVKSMRKNGVKLIWAANYFDEVKIRKVASKVGGRAFIVPMFVHGKPGIDNYFKLVDYWTDTLLEMSKVK